MHWCLIFCKSIHSFNKTPPCCRDRGELVSSCRVLHSMVSTWQNEANDLRCIFSIVNEIKMQVFLIKIHLTPHRQVRIFKMDFVFILYWESLEIKVLLLDFKWVYFFPENHMVSNSFSFVVSRWWIFTPPSF